MVIFFMRKVMFFIVIITLMFIPNLSFADDIDEIEEILEEDILDVSTSAEDVPKISSRACIVMDRESGQVLYEKNGYTKRKMASTTKILTAVVVLENADLKDVVEVSKKAGGTGGSRLGLKAKDKVSINDLLYGLMLRSRK